VKITGISFRPIVLVVLMAGSLQAADLAALTNQLISIDNGQRESAASEVSALSIEEQKQIATRLTPLLIGSDTEQRERAAEALAKLGPAAEPAIPALRQNLADDFPYVRIRSAEALSQIGLAAIPAFIDALKNNNNEVRLVAVQALSRLGAESKPAIPALVTVLGDKEASIRDHAANALESCGAEASPALMQALGEPNFKNRAGLVRVLGAIDGTPPHLPAQLIPFLSDSDADLRLAAIRALTRKGQSSVSALLLALNSDNALVRAESADILADIGPEAAEAVPALIGLLKDADPHVRASAAHALGKMREAGTPAVPALREALKDTDRDVAARAQAALTAITITTGGRSEVNRGYVSSSAPSAEPKKSAVKAKPAPKPLPKPKPKPKTKPAPAKPIKKEMPALPVSSYLTLDSTASIQALAMTAQKGTVETRAIALSALTSLLQSPDPKIQDLALSALEWVGTDDSKNIIAPYLKQEESKKINRLMEEIQTSTGSVKDAIDALASMGAAAVPAATGALKDSKSGVRLAGAQILTRIGPAASAAVPPLIDTLNDKDPGVRSQAAKALETINSPAAKNPLRIYYLKEKLRPYLAIVHISI
jgi:HEAT repeat protein